MGNFSGLTFPRTVYIAGPMTGVPEWNTPAFNAAAERLRELGFIVVNPADNGSDKEAWSRYMRWDIEEMIWCDTVVTLPGWENSKGAKLEVHIARELGMTVHDANEFVLAIESGAWPVL